MHAGSLCGVGMGVCLGCGGWRESKQECRWNMHAPVRAFFLRRLAKGWGLELGGGGARAFLQQRHRASVGWGGWSVSVRIYIESADISKEGNDFWAVGRRWALGFFCCFVVFAKLLPFAFTKRI